MDTIEVMDTIDSNTLCDACVERDMIIAAQQMEIDGLRCEIQQLRQRMRDCVRALGQELLRSPVL